MGLVEWLFTSIHFQQGMYVCRPSSLNNPYKWITHSNEGDAEKRIGNR